MVRTPKKRAKLGAVPTPPKKKKAPEVKNAWPRKPSIGWEGSRKQMMRRTGKGGDGSSYAIPFEGNGGPAGARKKAEQWLAKMNAEYAKFNS